MGIEVIRGRGRAVPVDYGKDFNHAPLGRKWSGRIVRMGRPGGPRVEPFRYEFPKKRLLARIIDRLTGRNTRVAGKVDRALERHSGKLSDILGDLCGLGERAMRRETEDFTAFRRALRKDMILLRNRSKALTKRGGDYGRLLEEQVKVHLEKLDDGELNALARGLDSRCMKGFRMAYFNPADLGLRELPGAEPPLLDDVGIIQDAVLREIVLREPAANYVLTGLASRMAPGRFLLEESSLSGTESTSDAWESSDSESGGLDRPAARPVEDGMDLGFFEGLHPLLKSTHLADKLKGLPEGERFTFLAGLRGEELNELEKKFLFWGRYDGEATAQIRGEIDRRTTEGKRNLLAVVENLRNGLDNRGVDAVAADNRTRVACREAQSALSKLQKHMESCEVDRFHDDEFFGIKNRLNGILEVLEQSRSTVDGLAEDLAALRETMED
ncbi:MAG TPA: hypothetical protein PLO86_11360 [Syntrophales bacterium]|nr:hypothetical protein [Syntrophales bacterium]